MSVDAIHVVCPSCRTVNRVPRARPAGRAKCGNCHRPLFAGKPVETGADDFDAHLAGNDIPVLVDFWAPWCGPCRAMAPAYEQAAAVLEPTHRLLKLNTEDAPAVAARYDIRSIPTMILFGGGKPIARTGGAMNAATIVAWVKAQSAAT